MRAIVLATTFLAGAALAPGVTKEQAAEALRRASTARDATDDAGARTRAGAPLAKAKTAFAEGHWSEAESLAEQALDALAATTTISVVVDPASGQTRFLVQDGSVEVSASGATAVAHPGEMVRADAGASPRVLTAKLAAPAPLQPDEGGTLRAVDGHLRWSKVDGADHYLVTVARDGAFHDRVATIESESASATLSPSLSTGGYHWRVLAVAPNGVEGPNSRARAFHLDTVVEPPQVARLYWLRDHRCAGKNDCAPWLAVDTETGDEREVYDVDLKALKLSNEKTTREKLVNGELAVRGTFRTDAESRSVLVVADVQGRR